MIACATIIRNDKVLLVKHSSDQKPDYGYWLLPAGRLEKGESLEEALEREMKEELNMNIRVIRKLMEIVDSYTGDKLTIFLCTPLTSRIKISSEIAKAKWLNLNEIQKLDLSKINPGLKQFLVNGLKSKSFQ